MYILHSRLFTLLTQDTDMNVSLLEIFNSHTFNSRLQFLYKQICKDCSSLSCTEMPTTLIDRCKANLVRSLNKIKAATESSHNNYFDVSSYLLQYFHSYLVLRWYLYGKI